MLFLLDSPRRVCYDLYEDRGMSMDFGTYLREKRRVKGLTQKELADKVGVSGAYINQLETKKVNAPTRETCQKLASTLNLSFDEVWQVARQERFSHFAAREGLEESSLLTGKKHFSSHDIRLITDPNFGKIYYELQGADTLSEREKRRLSRILLRVIRSYTSRSKR